MRIAGKIQLYPFLRIALFLIIGIMAGDMCSGVVSATTWQWVFLTTWLIAIALWKIAKTYRIRNIRLAKSQTLLLLLLIAVGGAWRMSNYRAAVQYFPTGCEEKFKAVVLTSSVDKPRSTKCELAIVDGRMKGKRVNAYFQTSSGKQLLSIGDGIEACAVFDEAYNSSAKSNTHFDYNRFLLVHGISARVFIADGYWRRSIIDLSPLPATTRLKLRLQSLRERLLKELRASGISPDEYATIAAMTLGDKTSISETLRNSYSKAGTSHILALSGLHIGIIYALLMSLFGNRRKSMARVSLVVIAIWLFAFMTGLTPSVARSAIMFTIYALVSRLTHDDISLNSIAAAASLILIFSPAALWDIGFQMSFMAVLGIVLCRMRMESARFYHIMWRRRWRRVVFSFVLVSLSAQVAVLPLSMHYFGNIPILFLVANIVAIPLATIIIYFAFFLFVLMPLCSLSSFLHNVWQWASNLLGYMANFLNSCTMSIASLSGASINGVYISTMQLVLIYVLMLTIWYLSGHLYNMYFSRHGITLIRRDYSGREIWDV